MEIADLLSVSGVSDGLKAGSKKQALQELSALAAAQTAQKERTVLDLLLARERLGSTGVGAGVAIPHAKLEGLSKALGGVRPLREPIEFDAVDGRPVDLIFLLLAPDSAGSDHLKALALVSRLLRTSASAHACAEQTAQRRSMPFSPVRRAPPGREHLPPAARSRPIEQRPWSTARSPLDSRPCELRRPGGQGRAAARRPGCR